MVDPTREIVKKQIVGPYLSSLDKCATTASMVQPTIDAIKELQKAILTEYTVYLSKVDNPHELAMTQNNTVDALLHKLQSAINEMNSGKIREIRQLQDNLAMQEHQLQSTESENLRTTYKTWIDQLRPVIDKLVAETQLN